MWGNSWHTDVWYTNKGYSYKPCWLHHKAQHYCNLHRHVSIHLRPQMLSLSLSALYCNTMHLMTLSDLHKKEKSTWSLMPCTFCLVPMNPDILKFNWEFYVTCRWQETYYSPSNTCRPPRSSSIRPRTPNESAACIIQHFNVKCLVKREHFRKK